MSLLIKLDPDLFPPDLGIDFRVGAKLYAKDIHKNWHLAIIVEIRPDSGLVLVHFEHFDKNVDQWIKASGGGLKSVDSDEKPYPHELLRAGDFVLVRSSVGKNAVHPAQITEKLDNGEFKLIHYNGYEQVAHRFTLKKMPDSEVKELDLANFGQLKMLPIIPNDSFKIDSTEPKTVSDGDSLVGRSPADEVDDVTVRKSRKYKGVKRDASGLLEFLQNSKLVPKEPDYRCCECGGPLKLGLISIDAWGWRCPNYTSKRKQKRRLCGYRVSMRRLTFFENSKLSIPGILKFVHFWLLDFTLSAIGVEAAIANEALVRWSSHCKEVLLRSMLENSAAPLGGPGRAVEIKGVEFKRREYESDYSVDGVWAYGGYERGSGRIFFVPIMEKSSAAFASFTKIWLLPGTTVIGDFRREFDVATRRQLNKGNCNITLKDADTETQNSVEESTENRPKTGFYGSRSRKPHRTAGNLAKYMFIERCNELRLDRETEFWKLVANLYNPIKMRDVRLPAGEKDEQEET